MSEKLPRPVCEYDYESTVIVGLRRKRPLTKVYQSSKRKKIAKSYTRYRESLGLIICRYPSFHLYCCSQDSPTDLRLTLCTLLLYSYAWVCYEQLWRRSPFYASTSNDLFLTCRLHWQGQS